MLINFGRNASRIATTFFAERNGSKQHTLISMGHCHIDTAWLWRYDETIRKCARSWSSQIGLMDEYPDFVFACSSAQQLAWVQQWYPNLFNQIKLRVAAGQFVPVGGAWIEWTEISRGTYIVHKTVITVKYY
jgi:alpha-mannosidase